MEKKKIYGKVYKVIFYSKKFQRIVLAFNGGYINVINKNKILKNKIHKGDYLCVTGYFRPYKNNLDFYVENLIKINSGDIKIKFNSRNIQLLGIRSEVSRIINTFLLERNFDIVQSPTVVSEWAEGKTKAFPIKYYNQNKYLSISNMLYHQIMLLNGMSKIYELGKLYRAEESGKKKLSEFSILDVSIGDAHIYEVMDEIELLINIIHKELKLRRTYNISILKDINFDKITYKDLIRNSKVTSFTGSQLPASCKEYLQKKFNSFVWVTGFPLDKRPFYTSSKNNVCLDAQLWYRGERYLAAGSEIESNKNYLISNIKKQGKNIDSYDFYLKYLPEKIPLMSMVGLGIELLIQCLVQETEVADFCWFPRLQNTYISD